MGGNDAVERWLASFEEALKKGDPQAVAGLFGDECYWRDLVAFTWNLRTSEGRGEIKAMLAATLASTRPSRFVPGNHTESDGWFTFDVMPTSLWEAGCL